MMIGNFRQQGDLYTGSIYGLGFNVPYVVFSPVPAKQGNGPDFVVLGAISEDDGGEFEIGAAWKKTSKKGRAYLSVKLDSPTLAAPINCGLTTQLDGSRALVWNRKVDSDADEEQAAA
jgi:uncharacterized protein (DUF736 family)